jgi:hypothetical protein
MKNLYKIEDELYIVSNTEGVSENCWIITSGKLVQVSYLLSDEVAKGFKVILTTNKLLIKDGVQAIDDDFLEWFVKNPSCEEVETKLVEFEVDMGLGEECTEYGSYYKIIIPKEEAKQDLPQFGTKEFNNLCFCFFGGKPKQETLEEAAENHYYKKLHISEEQHELFDYAFIEGAKWQQERSYSKEDLLSAFEAGMMFIGEDKGSFKKWFEQFKNK